VKRPPAAPFVLRIACVRSMGPPPGPRSPVGEYSPRLAGPSVCNGEPAGVAAHKPNRRQWQDALSGRPPPLRASLAVLGAAPASASQAYEIAQEMAVALLPIGHKSLTCPMGRQSRRTQKGTTKCPAISSTATFPA
jgi:hypothetical protein